MMRFRLAISITAALLILAARGSTARAIILHNDDEMPASQRPHDNVMGSWQHNASCVAIGPSTVVTTDHQGSSTTVKIGGITYDATSPVGWSGGLSGDDDIGMAQISLNGEPADLAYWVDPYTGDSTGDVLVFGGYGMGRGATLTTGVGAPYGYQWDGSENTTLRWGQNRVDMQVLDVMTAGFDGIGSGHEVPYEAAVAEYDSGGGWFIEENDRWYVAGLTIGTTHADIAQSWFAHNISAVDDPDRLDALRVEFYASWISGNLATAMPIAGDTDRDGDVDFDDLVALAVNYGATDAGWSLGNFNGDGNVDVTDLIMMGGTYGTGAPTGLSFADDLQRAGLVPEPTTIGLMAVGGILLLLRRDSNSL